MCTANARSQYSAYLSDMWASAVCLWIFIFGQLPFYHPELFPLFELIRSLFLFNLPLFTARFNAETAPLRGLTLSRPS
jgi:hypothetical protein